jgi:hypothetical protein
MDMAFGNIELTEVTQWNPDTMEFTVLRTDKEGAIVATIWDTSKAGNIIYLYVLKVEVV